MDGSFYYKHIMTGTNSPSEIRSRVTDIMSQRWPDMTKDVTQTVFAMSEKVAIWRGEDVGNEILNNFRGSEGKRVVIGRTNGDTDIMDEWTFHRKNGQVDNGQEVMDASLPLLIRYTSARKIKFEVTYGNQLYEWNLSRAHHLPT